MSNRSDDKILNFRVSGDGCPVVFLHGFLESISMWNYIAIPKGIKAILIDLPGHGKSENFLESMNSMADMAREVMKLIDHLEIDQYKLVGHSMGGYVGLELIKMDTRCEKLMLLNSNFWGDSEQKKLDRKRVAEVVKQNQSLFLYEAIPNLFFHPERHDQKVKEVIVEAMRMSPDAIGHASIAMSNRNDNSSWVLQNSDKVEVIQGADDTIVPIAEMKRLLSNSEVNIGVLNGAGHMAHIEASKRVEEFLFRFVQ